MVSEFKAIQKPRKVRTATMPVDADRFDAADELSYTNQDNIPETDPAFLVEQHLEMIIASARDIAIVSEEMLRELMTSRPGNIVTRSQGAAMAPMILSAAHKQLQSLLTVLRSE
jgi:hypothetical protein